MRRGLIIASLSVVTALGITLALESDANACGGCFHPPPPPTESPTVVTDHRMILSLSKDQSTLYDQIRYEGSPASFAWVLPISGTVDVGLSADIVFAGLDAMTRTVLQAPPQNCPPQPSGCSANRSASSAPQAGASSDGGGVNVLKKEIVGPYETVQLQASDPAALQNWLAKNGFVVPDDVKSVIDTYVAEKFNFLALKLIPGKGVQEMRPVRVTTQGANAVLPLRMVAAGTGASVGVGFWLVSEGRYEPQNFKSFYIKADELVWDWTAQKSNYVDLRAKRTAENNGRAWEVESSLPFSRQNLENYLQGSFSNGGGGFNGGGGAGAPRQTYPQTDEERAAQFYLAIKDEQGNVTKTAMQARAEDMAALFHGINPQATRVTRMRADLSRASLDVDLVMTASKEQAVLQSFRQITREQNEPICPIWNGCSQDGTAPRAEAYERSSGSGCSATSKQAASMWMGVGAAFVGLAVANGIRRRRQDAIRK